MGSSLAKTHRQDDTPESQAPSQNKDQAKCVMKVTTCGIPKVVWDIHAAKEQTHQEDSPSPPLSPNPSPRMEESDGPPSVTADGSKAEKDSDAQS